MVVWVVDQCLIARMPRKATPPHIERLVATQPEKSVSAQTVKHWSPFSQGQRRAARGRWSRYRARHTSAAQSSS
eukprot:14872139-Alexandrium_andersonii.AAC.1